MRYLRCVAWRDESMNSGSGAPDPAENQDSSRTLVKRSMSRSVTSHKLPKIKGLGGKITYLKTPQQLRPRSQCRHTAIPKNELLHVDTSRKIHLTILIWGSPEWCPVPPDCLWPPEQRCYSPEAARQLSSAAWGPSGSPETWLLLHVPHNYGTNGDIQFKKEK